MPHLDAVGLVAHGPRGAHDNALSFPKIYITLSLSVEERRYIMSKRGGGNFRENHFPRIPWDEKKKSNRKTLPQHNTPSLIITLKEKNFENK
jgi:hypothetical protein